MLIWRWLSLCGLGVFFGMVGCLFSLVSMVVRLGLRFLLKGLVISLSVLLAGILLVCLLSGGYLLILMLRVRLEELLKSLMCGLMAVWLMTGCLVPLRGRVL